MKIYIDLVFLLNIVLDFILLMSVSLVLKRNVKLKRLLLGSLFGGISIIILFININSFCLLILKIIMGIGMCLITFSFKNIRYTLNNIFYLLIISFIVGGGLTLIKDYYYSYIILIIFFIIIAYLYYMSMKKYKNSYSNYYKVDLYYKNKLYKLNGYLDTGNNLYDQYKHRPIILIKSNIKYNITDLIYVSYKCLNDSKVLKCLKVDKIIINNHEYHNYLIGLVDSNIEIDGVNCILHSSMKGTLC